MTVGSISTGQVRAPAWRGALADPRAALSAAFEAEVEQRRLFLWMPVAAGAGVVLYLTVDREPALAFIAPLVALAAALAFAVRRHRAAFLLAVAITAVLGGFLSGALRTARVAAPVLDRVRIATIEGFIEELDYRVTGARFILRVVKAEGLAPEATPYRVRLTARYAPKVAAGDYVSLKARLLPPSHAALPGGYDFARDAFFARIGAVGSTLGAVTTTAAPTPPDMALSVAASIDRARNTLALRVHDVLQGDAGAIAAAMVTGKRDLLSEDAKTLIREAGIFHIITISGVQMTLVAGLFFWGFRRALALSRTLALERPIKKWAAAAAIVGAIAYDVCTGSRVGTERALFMTLIMLGAVIADRQALTMRNLALAALLVIIVEPEAVLGASFQLSFAAVGALVAVHERRTGAGFHAAQRPPPGQGILARLGHKLRHEPIAMLAATACATAATVSFMAADFHEISPYVLIGNPLTLSIIEFFAVPGALIGAMLYPFGLDGFVWRYVGAGIDFILWAARHIAAAPGATVHVPSFAPWALGFLALAVLNAVIWRGALPRLLAAPFAALGLCGIIAGDPFDIAIAPGGDTLAARTASGALAVIGQRPNPFAAEQWLRADGDSRPARAAIVRRPGAKDAPMPAGPADARCDALGCVAHLANGAALALVADPAAFPEDCARAAIIVTTLPAPSACQARLVIDRGQLAQTGAVMIRFTADGYTMRQARGALEDRPWSRPPRSAGLARLTIGERAAPRSTEPIDWDREPDVNASDDTTPLD